MNSLLESRETRLNTPGSSIEPATDRTLASSLLLLAGLQSIEVELARRGIAALHALCELVLLHLALASARRRSCARSALVPMHNLCLPGPHHGIHCPVCDAHAYTRGHAGRHGAHETRHHASAGGGRSCCWCC